MTDKTNELGIVDTSLLTDADWAEINKLRRAHDEGGQRALSKALTELIDVDPVRATRVIGAFFPKMVRETIKDVMAEKRDNYRRHPRTVAKTRKSSAKAMRREVEFQTNCYISPLC
jgi:hypothetical protein